MKQSRFISVPMCALLAICLFALTSIIGQQVNRPLETARASTLAAPTGTYTVQVTIDGIPGDAKGSAIAVSLFSFQVSTPAANPTNTDGRTNVRPAFSPIVFTKGVDSASPNLFKAAALNQNITSATFVFLSTANGQQSVHHKIKLTDVTISNFKQDVDAQGHEIETITLVYATIEYIQKNTDVPFNIQENKIG